MDSITRTRSDNQNAVVLAKAEWTFEKGSITNSVPNTWSLPPQGLTFKVMGETCKVLALFRCPHCKSIGMLVERVHVIDHVGKVSPDVRCNTCHLHRPFFLDRWNIKPLYACAVERRVGTKISREIHYMHATTAAEARFHLGQGNYHVVAIGPAIGMLATDDHGDNLVADSKGSAA